MALIESSHIPKECVRCAKLFFADEYLFLDQSKKLLKINLSKMEDLSTEQFTALEEKLEMEANQKKYLEGKAEDSFSDENLS